MSPSTLATPVFPKRVLDLLFPLFPPEMKIGKCVKLIVLLAKILKAPGRSAEHAEIVQF